MSGGREAEMDGPGTDRETDRESAALSVTEKAPE
jgi:hypothetical protein